MHIGSNSNPNKIAVFILNGFSLLFKIVSLINLKIKSLRQVTYEEAFIVSVDNLSFGGTGKTPLVIQIGEHLQKKKLKFAVITRGYKSEYEKRGIKALPVHTVKDIGDEAILFKKTFKNQDILVGKNRHDSIKEAIQSGNRIILLDDGFQSTDIFKNLKILLVNPNHHYYFLRNFKFMAKREDIILTYNPGWSSSQSGPQPQVNLFPEDKPLNGVYNFERGKFYDQKGRETSINNSPIFGFSAIGDNLRFKKDLSSFHLVGFKGYRDHHKFTERELSNLDNTRKQNRAEYLVCTEKDFARIFPILGENIPLIYLKNRIKYSINLTDILLIHAKKKNVI